jgi:hypothetical protein
MTTLKIDGARFDLPCHVDREATMQSSDLSGLLMDKTFFNDVLGTYLRYSAQIAVPIGKEDIYSQLYEILTEPVEGHVFELPYNQKTVTITGRVESVQDIKYKSTWRGIKFAIIANNPTKEMSLDEVIERGISELPNVSPLDRGKIYMVNEYGEWELFDIGDADVRKY